MDAQRLAERRKGIGGSDAAVVAGLSPWKTPLQLYYEKRGELEPDKLDDLEHIRWGTRLEDAIAAEYAERTGRTVHRVNQMLTSKENPFMLANLDRRVVGEPRLLEVKTTNEFAFRKGEWGEEGSDEVPEQYLMQVQHYLAVTGYGVGDLAVLVGGNKMRIYEIERDDELIMSLVDIEREFWERVETGTPPPIDWMAPKALDLVKKRYPGTSGEAVNLPDNALMLHQILRDTNEQMKLLKKQNEAAKAQLLDMMGEAAVGLLSEGAGSYRRRLVDATEVSYTRKAYVDFRFSKSTEV